MKKPASPTPPAALGHDALLQLVEELQAQNQLLEEEKRMRDTFSHISETGHNDAALMWRGRNRFLSETVAPVNIRIKPEQSYPVGSGGDHRVIDGDNLAVMRSLLTEFRGGPRSGFDVIYMDPPYNTGKDTFAYNDNYRFTKAEVERMKNRINRVEKGVSLDDPSRHTKWINHMAPRLHQAKKLLKDTGVIIISIDEHELPRLWLLMEEMFQEKNRLATLIWERSRKNDASYISEGHEYLLVWAKNKAALDGKIKQMAMLPAYKSIKGKWREPKPGLAPFLAEADRLQTIYQQDFDKISEGLRLFVKGVKKGNPLKTISQYVWLDDRFEKLGPFKEEDPSWPGGGGGDYVVKHPKTHKTVKTPPKGWLYSEEDFWALDADDRIIWKGVGTPKVKKYLLEGRENDVITSVIQKESRQSVMTLKALVGFEDAIDHPKDHLLLQRLFSVVTWNDPEAKFFDPYGGSGTTGHAVLAMNDEDGGQRRFVLVENGDPTNKKIPRKEYTDRLTAERLRRLLSGQWADGKLHPALPGGFTFYEAHESVSRKAIMAYNRENMADIILQLVEEDSNRYDCRMDGYEYLIGRSRLGYGIALVWQEKPNGKMQELNKEIRSAIMREADKAGVTKPVYIYAVANVSPINDALYRFQQIPDSLLSRLNLVEEDEDDTAA